MSMPRILHASDLHLSNSEREYGLAVFSELVEIAEREKVDYFIFCGDLFDTFADAEKLRIDFRNILENRSFEFLYLPGNHEDLRRGGGDLARLDLGPAKILSGKPFEILQRNCDGLDIEFLAIPHQLEYSTYSNWPVNSKAAPIRLALAHGVVAGMSYQGPDEEGGGAAIDVDLFQRFSVDYAAMGHIHGRRMQNFPNPVDANAGGNAGPGSRSNSLTISYPGSSRVWRKGELGPRGALLFELSQNTAGNGGTVSEPVFIPIHAAGEYRHYDLPLTLEGAPPNLDRILSKWGKNDFIELEFSGLVEDEKIVAQLAESLKAQYGNAVRKLEIDREGISALPGIASHPVVKNFLEEWNRRKPSTLSEHQVWMRARHLALNALKIRLGRHV